MESVFQDEAVFSEAELTPQDQIKVQWQQQPGFPFIRQKNVIDQHAELLPYAAAAGLKGWNTPFLFALQGLVLIAVVLSLANWQMTRHAGTLEDEIVASQANAQAEIKRQEEIIAATEAEIRRISNSAKPSFKLHLSATPMSREQALQVLNASLEESHRSEEQYKEKMAAQEQELRSRQSALAVANSGSPLIFSLALVLAAGLFGNGAQKDFPRTKQGRRLKDFYLYLATTEGLWPNLVLLAFLHIALSRSAYGLSGMFESVGPLFWVVFSLGFYFLLLRYFVMVSRSMYKAVQLRPPANEWAFDNRILFRIHNSFLLVFAGMEAIFLALCYAMYLAQNRLA
ncbi:MAG: hypothetical protein WA738_19395 [Candidatus Angelobacter sp.]